MSEEEYVYVAGCHEGEQGKFIVDRVFRGDEEGLQQAKEHCKTEEKERGRKGLSWHVLKAPLGGFWLDWKYV